MKQFFCELLFICSTATGPGAQPIDDLAYGTVLYEYYQEEYSEALLNVMIAESRGQLGEDAVRFELAKGSFAFAEGMYGYANEVFTGVPDGELTELDQMRLAFHLSREYHRRQDWDALGEELAKIDLGKSWLGKQRVHPEVEFMKAEHAVEVQDFATAETAFAAMDPESPLRAYGVYNLGVAYREAGRLDDAMRTFRGLSKMPTYTQEALDLSQRARLALALIARDQQNHTRAENVLADLPSEGRYQDVAMAAYGGLAMDTENYELAARIWMTLQEESYWTPSTATARLGFPMSLEKMSLQDRRASTDLALQQYKRAEESFSHRHASLTALTNAASDPSWVTGLLEVFARPLQLDEDGKITEAQQFEMQALMQNWEKQLGHTDWLEWLATDSVHQALVQWRDLGEMQTWLGGMQERMNALSEVAVEQQSRSERARGMLVDDGLLEMRTALEAQTVALKERLGELAATEPALTNEWMYPLANSEERELLSDLARMESLLVHMKPADQAKWSARIDRLKGVVFYEVVAEQKKRERVLNKELKALQAELASIDDKIARVTAAEEQFVAGVGADFTLFQSRADDLLAQVNLARSSREELLAGEIRSRMQDEMQTIEKYLLVTRIAIARATDQLAMQSDGVQQ